MKLKTVLIILLLQGMFVTIRAQDSDNPVLTLRQSAAPGLNLRITNSHIVRSGPAAAYASIINFVIREDYSNPGRYVVSLNPALWALETGLASFLWVNDTSHIDWITAIPATIVLIDLLANFKLDIYWLHTGWDTDFYIYDKKFLVVWEFTFALKYEFKRIGVYAGIKGGMYERQPFMLPQEKDEGQAVIGLSYNFDNGPVGEFIGLRGRKWVGTK